MTGGSVRDDLSVRPFISVPLDRRRGESILWSERNELERPDSRWGRWLSFRDIAMRELCVCSLFLLPVRPRMAVCRYLKCASSKLQALWYRLCDKCSVKGSLRYQVGDISPVIWNLWIGFCDKGLYNRGSILYRLYDLGSVIQALW